MKSLGIIPARYASTRFPGKPLALIGGQTMVERVYAQASKSQLDEVIVATDDSRIFDHIRQTGGWVVMTSPTHRTGTDRCAEVVQLNAFHSFDHIVNIQGDEPFIQPQQINLVLEALQNNHSAQIATLAKKIDGQEECFNPNVVKVVFDNNHKALYFSRSAIPFVREKIPGEWPGSFGFYKHIGLYGYRRDVLTALAGLSPGMLEKAESLEQLRWMEHGFSIQISLTDLETRAIDTPEDLAAALADLDKFGAF